MASDNSIKAAWISGSLTLVGAIIAALVTGGFGLFPKKDDNPTPSTPPSPSSTPTTAPPANAVPLSYQGTWTGVVTQADGSPYQLTLKIGPGNDGTYVGSWQLTTFNCTGVLYLESGGGPLELQQITDFNANDECYAHDTFDVTLQGSDLAYEIIGATQVDGQFFAGNPTLATGTLSPTG